MARSTPTKKRCSPASPPSRSATTWRSSTSSNSSTRTPSPSYNAASTRRNTAPRPTTPAANASWRSATSRRRANISIARSVASPSTGSRPSRSAEVSHVLQVAIDTHTSLDNTERADALNKTLSDFLTSHGLNVPPAATASIRRSGRQAGRERLHRGGGAATGRRRGTRPASDTVGHRSRADDHRSPADRLPPRDRAARNGETQSAGQYAPRSRWAGPRRRRLARR